MNTRNLTVIDKQIDRLLNPKGLERNVTVRDYNWNHCVKKLVASEIGIDAFDFIDEHVPYHSKDVFIGSINRLTKFTEINIDTYKTVVNLKSVNHLKNIKQYFETINTILPLGGFFITKIQTQTSHKDEFIKKISNSSKLSSIFGDSFLAELCSKFSLSKSSAANIEKATLTNLNKAETFRWLYFCGFEVIKELTITNELYFVAKKIKKPIFSSDIISRQITNVKKANVWSYN